MKRTHKNVVVLDNVSANTITVPHDFRDFRHVICQLVASGSADMDFKFFISMQKEAPDFTQPVSASNLYSVIRMRDLDPVSTYTTASPFVLDGTKDGGHALVPDTDQINWFGVQVLNYVAGNVSLIAAGATDQ